MHTGGAGASGIHCPGSAAAGLPPAQGRDDGVRVDGRIRVIGSIRDALAARPGVLPRDTKV